MTKAKPALPKEVMIFIQDKEISIKVKFKNHVNYEISKTQWKIHAEGGDVEMWVCRDNPGKLKDKRMFIKCAESQTRSEVTEWPKREMGNE